MKERIKLTNKMELLALVRIAKVLWSPYSIQYCITFRSNHHDSFSLITKIPCGLWASCALSKFCGCLWFHKRTIFPRMGYESPAQHNLRSHFVQRRRIEQQNWLHSRILNGLSIILLAILYERIGWLAQLFQTLSL